MEVYSSKTCPMKTDWNISKTGVNGKSRIPKQRYCTHMRPYFGGISPFIGLIYGRNLQSIGSWHGHWSMFLLFSYGFPMIFSFLGWSSGGFFATASFFSHKTLRLLPHGQVLLIFGLGSIGINGFVKWGPWEHLRSVGNALEGIGSILEWIGYIWYL